MYKFYFSKTTSIIASISFSLFCSILPLIMFLYNANLLYKIISFLMWIVMLCIMLYNSFARKIELSKKGVQYTSLTKVYQMNWEEIKEIGIADYTPYNKGGSYPFIFFSKTTGNSLLILNMKINQDYILIRYRKKVISAIEKYWDKEIINRIN